MYLETNMSNNTSKPIENPFVNTMVKAGAGAGKTYGLIHKIVELVYHYSSENKGALPRFVVTTFTRKATQEVRERLLKKALEIQQTDPEFGDIFLKFLKSTSFLLVSTIHGVLNVFLRQYGALIGLDPDFKVQEFSEKQFHQLLHDLLVQNSEFKELVKKFGWRRIKMFLLEHHQAYILNPEIHPVNKDWFYHQWEEQFKEVQLLSQDLIPTISELLSKSKSQTLRSFYDCLLQLQKITSPMTSNEFSKVQWEKFNQIKEIAKMIPRKMGAMSNWEESAKESRSQLVKLIDEVSEDRWRNREDFEVHLLEQQKLSQLGIVFSQEWFKRKITNSEIELADLELLTLLILRRFPEETKAFTESWNYWFIDEYQDTSPIQVEILNNLIGACPHYVVGDPQQSIYFFRGARSKVFHDKLKLFADNSAKIEEKKINRRSQTPTLLFINELMDKVNPHQFVPMESISENYSKELLVGHFYRIDEDNEKQHLLQVSQAVKTLINKGVSPDEIALLCRENSQLQKLFSHFKKQSIPAQILSQGQFTEDRAVRDALSLWKFLVNPYDDINLMELLRSFAFNVSEEILFTAAQEKRGALWISLSQYINDSEPTLIQLHKALNSLANRGHFQVWRDLLLNSKLFDECTAVDLSGRKEGNLWKLINIIYQGIHSGELNYADPLHLELNSESNTNNEAQSIRESHQVQLLTIHGSKGLEFSHVFLPFINHTQKKDGASFWSIDLNHRFWSISMVDESDMSTQTSLFAKRNAEEMHSLLLEESERLFYVAVTRAKKSLHFFAPQNEKDQSNSGWAQYLNPFLNREPGLYLSSSGDYEFKIHSEVLAEDHKEENFAEVPFIESTYSSKTSIAITKSDSLKGISIDSNKSNLSSPTKDSFILANSMDQSIDQKRSYTITELLSLSTQQPISTNSSISVPNWDFSAVKKGVKTHRQLECFYATKQNSILTRELTLYLEQIDIPLLDIMTNGFSEWPFVVQEKRNVVEGQIDLWGRDSNGQLWIVDYKTGSSANFEKAFLQMYFYAWGLLRTKQMSESENVTLAVCYPFSQQTHQRVVAPVEILQKVNQIFQNINV